MAMDYSQVLEYLISQLPMFHRVGPAAYKADLSNILKLTSYLGNPHLKFKSIHIAGTNGKGSVSHMLASVFHEAGYKTGLCTSPHLKDFRERIRVNGEMIEKDYITRFVNDHKDFLEEVKPSFFEMTIALTFDYFASQKVDIAIIETGLGGRLDSTNVITPELSVITNIGYDHMNLLGNTLEEIAFEKAGIIKDGTPVVLGKTLGHLHPLFIQVASSKSAQIVFSEDHLGVANHNLVRERSGPLLWIRLENVANGNATEILSPLTGSYQIENIVTVITAIDVVNSFGQFKISEEKIKAGIRNVIKNTGFQGRWQVLNKVPLTICDTGHNEDGIRVVLKNIYNTPHNHLHFVIGMVNDKDVRKMLGLLPTSKTTYYFCKPDVPRGLNADELASIAKNYGLGGDVYESVRDAYETAMGNAKEDDLVFIGGSTFVVAEVV